MLLRTQIRVLFVCESSKDEAPPYFCLHPRPALSWGGAFLAAVAAARQAKTPFAPRCVQAHSFKRHRLFQGHGIAVRAACQLHQEEGGLKPAQNRLFSLTGL